MLTDSEPSGIADESLTRRDDERGQGMVEYAFILVLVVMVVVLMVMVLGRQTGNLYSNVSSGLGT